MSIFLCGNTGTINRGCEAIIRSTIKVLNRKSGSIYLATQDSDYDRPLGRELGINIIPYDKYPSKIHHCFSTIVRKIMNKRIDYLFLQANLIKHIKKGDICLNIGGDTYCYNPPIYSMDLNYYTYTHNIPCILWCCSIGKEYMTKEIIIDLKRYKYIFAREQETYKNLIDIGIEKDKLIKTCDPAFFLDAKDVELPVNFAVGNTVGINISECVAKENEIVNRCSEKLIEHIIQNTDMNICLIPHVYNIKKRICDWPFLQRLYNRYKSDRVSIVDKELNCEELKFIISKCRYMIAARTHASIAAYSSMVPTVVIGYSIKSVGIAKDLFGTDKNYVLSYENIKNEDALINSLKFLQKNEEIIKQDLSNVLPSYKNQLTEAIKKLNMLEMIPKYHICDINLCTGCMACKSACPQNAIGIKKDYLGFYYPNIDNKLCINCEKCRSVCPSLNRYRDNNVKPELICAFNKDPNIRLNSSSGGIFYSFAKLVIENGGIVYGTVFDNNYNTIIESCSNINEIYRFQGSKYVQSSTENTYKEVKEYLDKGITVLYSGTPCQISGLKSFLRDKYNNLITVDFVCHGAASPRIWAEYKNAIANKLKSEISNVSFRNKDTGWKTYSLKITCKNGLKYSNRVSDDIYMKSFLSNYIIRDSCFECPSQNMHRNSDITLADFWEINDSHSDQNDNLGASIILIQSNIGKILIDKIKTQLCIIEVDQDIEFSKMIQYTIPVKKDNLHLLFRKRITEQNFFDFANIFYSKHRMRKISNRILKIFYWPWK